MSTSSSGIRYGQIDRDYAMRLATTPAAEDGPVWMVNLMKYREVADYADGRADRISGREADDRYAPHGPLAAVGGPRPVFVADVDTQLLGTPAWDRVGIVRYPTRRAFIEMQALPEFAELHQHKDAGMEQTIVMGCRPLPFPEPTPGIVQPDWAEVPHPPTEDDGPVMVVHVIRFTDTGAATPGFGDTDTDHMTAYQRAAERVAVGHGVRIAGWFQVDGTIVGDGRAWHQVRCNAFPSRRAFMAVAMDPDRLAAQAEHRETAIADTFAMITRASIDEITASIS